MLRLCDFVVVPFVSVLFYILFFLRPYNLTLFWLCFVFLKKGTKKIIKNIKEQLISNGAIGAMMSGSGPTVFGLFDKKEDALSAKGELLKKYNQVYVVRSSEKGVEVNGEFN